MILRRLKAHVEKENWFAVAIDFCIVVIGVFIGLQVSNWSNERQARGEEQQYLRRLHDDFEASIRANENLARFMSYQVENNSFAIEALRACELVDLERDRFASAIISIGKIIPTQLFDATIKELNATGKFQYIRSEDIRQAISRHLDEIEVEGTIQNAIEQRAIPHTVYIESQIEYNITRVRELDDDPTWSDLRINFDQLCEDERFRRAISVTNVYISDITTRVVRNTEAQKEILDLISSELN